MVTQQTRDVDPTFSLMLAHRLRRWPNIKSTWVAFKPWSAELFCINDGDQSYFFKFEVIIKFFVISFGFI